MPENLSPGASSSLGGRGTSVRIADYKDTAHLARGSSVGVLAFSISSRTGANRTIAVRQRAGKASIIPRFCSAQVLPRAMIAVGNTSCACFPNSRLNDSDERCIGQLVRGAYISITSAQYQSQGLKKVKTWQAPEPRACTTTHDYYACALQCKCVNKTQVCSQQNKKIISLSYGYLLKPHFSEISPSSGSCITRNGNWTSANRL